jgi:phage terminase Nu1 subunit (DNA packaging protein)
MVRDQDIAKGTFVKEDFDEVHFKFETYELTNMKAQNHQLENQQWMSNIESKDI